MTPYNNNRIPSEQLIAAALLIFAMMILPVGEANATDAVEAAESRSVSYGDLDLLDETDLLRLEDRIEQTASRLCRRLATSLSSRLSLERCTARAAELARPQIEAAVNRARSRQ